MIIPDLFADLVIDLFVDLLYYFVHHKILAKGGAPRGGEVRARSARGGVRARSAPGGRSPPARPPGGGRGRGEGGEGGEDLRIPACPPGSIHVAAGVKRHVEGPEIQR